MKSLFSLLLIGWIISIPAAAQTNSTTPSSSPAQTVETIVLIRHGEKPPGGLGQLTCRGLNRALALPKVLLDKYGPPQFIFAPNPTQKVDGNKYYYVRPLTTIEPTAIHCGLSVNTKYGFREIQGLARELQEPQYANATIFIAWEHVLLDEFARRVVTHHHGNVKQVPDWPGNDYDTIFVFKITHQAGQESLAFHVDHESLNDLSDNCP